MTRQFRQPLSEGETITHQVHGHVITVMCVRPGHAYMWSVLKVTGNGVALLATPDYGSCPTEVEARTIARQHAVRLHGVADMENELAAAAAAGRPVLA